MNTDIRTFQLLGRCLGASALAVSLVACGGSSSSTATPTPPAAAAFKGQYVISINGTDPNDGDYAVAGSLAFDGAGKITAGVADYNLGSGIDQGVQLTGTYTASGSTALVTLTDSGGTQDTFTATISGSSIAVQGFDGTGTGTMAAQAATTAYAPAGTYTYSLDGDGQNALTSTGGFVVAGNTITSGTQKNTDGAVVTNYASISGVVEPVQASGRGVAAIGPFTFAYYPVTANSIVLVGLDDRALLSGTAQKQ